ncbi:hypothetical protein Sn250709_109 [Synechococcus phage S-RIM2]|jgi:hypothetical protein|uniref:Uncharacterized protein n=3 Tax=Nerrivikvirus srim2 TaxID=2734125 RepID=A0A1D7S863_9CAUD|nr:hypothetical protein SWRG_00097 [Synechococcus phage S-RIM2 R21_2007]AGH07002.1 hypothetical protein SWUG_00092 [Synechococcus phage S-RIM2 R9_2006]AON97622.1 hypothetical protein Fa020709_109 [Synechococcus phage S-RIM2]AON97836.1 hypothetical protein Fa100709_109 [Synechococcus phage S-RIM2]AON98050.1 hypothetical protein Fa240709_109 [Synechococcus phage S-RIM2]
MAEHHTLEWIGTISLFIFGITMICQGHFIVTGKHGYKHDEREKQKMADARKQIEDLFKK